MSLLRCTRAAQQAHTVSRRVTVALDSHLATALRINHPSAVVATMVMMMVVVAVMPPVVAHILCKDTAATGHDEHEGKKRAKFFHS